MKSDFQQSTGAGQVSGDEIWGKRKAVPVEFGARHIAADKDWEPMVADSLKAEHEAKVVQPSPTLWADMATGLKARPDDEDIY